MASLRKDQQDEVPYWYNNRQLKALQRHTVRTPDIEYHFKPGIYHLKYPENFELNSNILNSDR